VRKYKNSVAGTEALIRLQYMKVLSCLALPVSNVNGTNFPTTITSRKGSGYRTACGSINLKPYSITSCNVTVTHEENVVGLAET